ncbi:hypothetical protein HMPREF9348_04681 [Escherichia coli MS 145-7]|nr:hypothetical protein HMPREF9348_04681 [Escherichia coli MS 145-7]
MPLLVILKLCVVLASDQKRIKVNRAVFASSLFIFNCQPKLISAL